MEHFVNPQNNKKNHHKSSLFHSIGYIVSLLNSYDNFVPEVENEISMILFAWLIDVLLNLKLNLRTSPIHKQIIQISFVI